MACFWGIVMTQKISAQHFEQQVMEAVRSWGYKARSEPFEISNRRLWKSDPASLVRGPRYQPDILVENNGEVVLIETKTSLVLLGQVLQVREYKDYFDAHAIVCVPDKEFPRIPTSVREFASKLDIHLCSLSRIEEMLAELLGASASNRHAPETGPQPRYTSKSE